MKAYYFLFALALGGAGPLSQIALAEQTNLTGFNVDVIETDVTYQTPGGVTLLTAQNLLVTRQLSDFMGQTFVNGELLSIQSLASMRYTPDPTETYPQLVPPLNLTPYAAANLPLLGGASRFDFTADLPGNPVNVDLPEVFLNHTGTVEDLPVAAGDEFTAGPSDLEGLLPGATVTNFSSVLADNEEYLDAGTNASDTEFVQPLINANFIVQTVTETVDLPENTSAAPLLGIALASLFAFSVWKSRGAVA